MMRFTIATTLLLFGSQPAWAELPKVPQNEAWRATSPQKASGAHRLLTRLARIPIPKASNKRPVGSGM